MADERPILISCSRPGNAFNVIVGDCIVVGGWALAPAGVERVEAILAGSDPVRLAFPSTDAPADVRATYPGYPDAAACGFAGVVPVNGVANGRTTLGIRVTARDGQTAELPVPIEIDCKALANGRILALIDRPIPPPGRAVVTEGHLGVRGWALSGAGIDRVEAVVGGEARGRVRLGMLRPDVPRAYPDIPGVEHSGFVGLIPVTDLAPGIHRVLIRVVGGNGSTVEVEREFEVVAPRTIFGQAPRANAQYAEWLQRHEPTPEEIARAREAAQSAPRTTFSMICAIDGEAPPERLAGAVDVLRAQAYPYWEALVAVDVRTTQDVIAAVDGWAGDDERIQRIALTPNPSPAAAGEGSGVRAFSTAANAALRAANGDFVICLAPGDRLSPLALAEIAAQAARTPDVDLIYTDEDKIGPSGERWDPFFKPDWAPDLLQSLDYIGPFAAIRRDAALALGGFGDDLPGAEQYDLTLRIADRHDDPGVRVVHLPRLLFSRFTPSPDAQAGRDEAAEKAGRRAVAASVARQGIEAMVEPGLIPGARRVRRALRERPPVTLVVPTGGKLHYLRPCLDSLLSTTAYPDIRLLVVDNSSGDEVAVLCDDLGTTGHASAASRFRDDVQLFGVVNHGSAGRHAVCRAAQRRHDGRYARLDRSDAGTRPAARGRGGWSEIALSGRHAAACRRHLRALRRQHPSLPPRAAVASRLFRLSSRRPRMERGHLRLRHAADGDLRRNRPAR